MDKVDVDNGRVRVLINADEPLQFERKAGYANGDVINVSLAYEELHRFCFTCKMISHEEGTCPELTPEQREANRLARLEKKRKRRASSERGLLCPDKRSRTTYKDRNLNEDQRYLLKTSIRFRGGEKVCETVF